MRVKAGGPKLVNTRYELVINYAYMYTHIHTQHLVFSEGSSFFSIQLQLMLIIILSTICLMGFYSPYYTVQVVHFPTQQILYQWGMYVGYCRGDVV